MAVSSVKPSVVTCKGSVPAVVHLVIACMLARGMCFSDAKSVATPIGRVCSDHLRVP